jgi:hypothetical protein
MLVDGNSNGMTAAPQGGADPDEGIDVACAADGNQEKVSVNLGRGRATFR